MSSHPFKLRLRLPKLKLRLRLTANDNLYIFSLFLVMVQIFSLLLSCGVISTSHSTTSLHWMLFTSTTVTIGLILAITRFLISNESARAQAIAEFINDGLLFIEGSRVVFANPLARKLLRNTGPNPTLTVEVSAALEQSRKSLTPVHYEATLDGRLHHFLISKIPVPADGQIYVFQDVTFLRENEEAKVNFIGALSHEIKTPITSLAMALAMLDRSGYDPELVRIANSDVGRLRFLLDDLLNVSRLKIVRNPHNLQKRDTNLTTLVHQTIKSVSALAEHKEIRIQSRIHARGHVLANIDPTKIAWVISTLLTDAIRQTPRGNVVNITLDYDGFLATFEVLYIRRFDSLGPTGHAIVQDIIEAHAGRFTTTHRENQESLFKFSIHAYLNRAKSTKGQQHEAHLTG